MDRLDSTFQGSFGLAEYMFGASSIRFRNYEVDLGEAGKKDFGQNLNGALSYAHKMDGGLVRNWIVNDWSFGLVLPPQNALTTDQKTFVQEAINRASELYDAKRCKDFINALLQRATRVVVGHRWFGNPDNPVSIDGVFPGYDGAATLWKYQGAVYNGWVTASLSTGVSGDNVVYGHTHPTGNFPVAWNNEFFKLSRDDAGLQTLHESLHQLSGFDDQTLANAARFAVGERQRDFTKVKDPVGVASRDLNRVIASRCAP